MIYCPVTIKFGSTISSIPPGYVPIVFTNKYLLYKPPEYNSTNFNFLDAITYLPPDYNITNFSFEPVILFVDYGNSYIQYISISRIEVISSLNRSATLSSTINSLQSYTAPSKTNNLSSSSRYIVPSSSNRNNNLTSPTRTSMFSSVKSPTNFQKVVDYGM